MAQDTNIDNLIINKMTKAQYDELDADEQINDEELYMITDDDGGLDNKVDKSSFVYDSVTETLTITI